MADRRFTLHVIRGRRISYLVSSVMILAGIALILFKGFNLGIDFESGLSQTVQLAPSGMSIAYDGPDSVSLRVSGGGFILEFRNAEGVSRREFPFDEYPTCGAFAQAAGEIEGIRCEVFNPALSSANVITGFGFPATLKQKGFVMNFADASGAVVTIEQVREALGDLNDVRVQSVGNAIDQVYQIRMKLSDETESRLVQTDIQNALKAAFGSDTVVVLETNFIGAKFSSSLLSNSLLAVAVAVVLILLYVWMRFELGYALCSVLALLHDVLCMLGFIALMRFSVSSTTIAAVLTIIGYSLNNTIVIMDRVRGFARSDVKMPIEQMIDASVDASLGRTTISSVTTIIAIIPLCVFASGDIFYFAASLLFGIIVGTYSSNFIAPALLHDFAHVPALDPMKLKEKKGPMSDKDSAEYLMESSVMKANAARMQDHKEEKRRKGKKGRKAPPDMPGDDASSARRRSRLRLDEK